MRVSRHNTRPGAAQPSAAASPCRRLRARALARAGLVLAGLLVAGRAPAATRYVRAGNAQAAPPYTSWATAAATIQAALARSVAGDTVVVSNGVYDSGSALAAGMLCRVALTNAVVVRSLNGPAATLIKGAGPMGVQAVRCAYVAAGATLAGFTLTNGVTRADSVAGAEMSGGGAWCEPGGLLSNCVVAACTAAYAGGGIYHGDVVDCVLSGNAAARGGGLYGGSAERCRLRENRATEAGGGTMLSDLRNSVLSGNVAPAGAGASRGTLRNCTVAHNTASLRAGGGDRCEFVNSIVYYNSAPADPNGATDAAAVRSTCTLPAPASNGNVAAAPLFLNAAAGDYRLTAASPCLNAGSNALALGSADVAGDPRILEGRVDMGAHEFHRIVLAPDRADWAAAGGTGTVAVAASAGYPWVASAAAPWLRVLGAGTGVGTGTVQYVVSANTGAARAGALAVAELSLPVRQAEPPAIRPTYVALTGRHVAPFDTWYKAATTLQAAVDVAPNSGVVWVSNGTYRAGGTLTYGTLNNRVAVSRGITLRSLRGATHTWIIGKTGSTPGRCVYVWTGSTVEGFTLSEGTGRSVQGIDGSGTGAFVEPGGLLLKCVVRDCVAFDHCAGAYGGGRVSRCVLFRNRAAYGAGAVSMTLSDCLIVSNSATFYGGGAMYGDLNNCAVWGNTAQQGGGTYWSTISNSIVYANQATVSAPNYAIGTLGSVNYSCTTPLPAAGSGNFTNSPLLRAPAAWDFRLQAASPCINRGSRPASSGLRDLDGQMRPLGPAVDVGAYEYWAAGADGNTNAVPDDWELAHFGCLDYLGAASDWDGDRFPDRMEYLAGTNPTNPASCLRLLDLRWAGSHPLLRWQGVAGKRYRLLRSPNLTGSGNGFTTVRTGISGAAPLNTHTDATATVRAPWFYRVELE